MEKKRNADLRLALICIAIYVVIASVINSLIADGLSQDLLILPMAGLLAGYLLLLRRTNRLAECGFVSFRGFPWRGVLYLLPMAALATANLWRGMDGRMDAGSTVLYMLSMLMVGFVEEILFRGLLLRAMLKEGSLRAAVIVSSVTFGLGHIVNLFSGADLAGTLLQLVYACAVGFMLSAFVLRTGNLLPCCLFHGIFNALSVFSNEAGLTIGFQIIGCIAITAISLAYAAYLWHGRSKAPLDCDQHQADAEKPRNL